MYPQTDVTRASAKKLAQPLEGSQNVAKFLPGRLTELGQIEGLACGVHHLLPGRLPAGLNDEFAANNHQSRPHDQPCAFATCKTGTASFLCLFCLSELAAPPATSRDRRLKLAYEMAILSVAV